MKKGLLIYFFILLLVGCNNQKLNLNSNDFIGIKYNDINIVPADYTDITNIINKINFTKDKIDGEFNNNLIIKTNTNIYTLSISNNNFIKYKNNDELLYSKDKKNNKELIASLTSLNSKYINSNFYTIHYVSEYQPVKEDLFIKLDNYNNLLLLTSTENIYNFKIHTIEYSNNTYNDIDLLSSNNTIAANQKIVIRKTINETLSNIRISFETTYNYTVSIRPIYNKNLKKIEFITDFNAKENP